MSEIHVDILKQELKDALIEVARLKVENQNLRAENQHFRDMLKLPDKTLTEVQIAQSFIDKNKENQLNDQTKVELFRSLFRGREDVYAVRWEGRNGSHGYVPACKNERLPGICIKPKVKCQECSNRELLPLTDQVIIDHLKGKHTIGVYPLLQDETCWFLAVDFDKKTWQDDAVAFIEKSLEMKIPAVLERSRSGNGGHVWIFFDRPIPAVTARQLGSIIRKCARQNKRLFSTDSFDRFFPSQDTMPKGEFGNLIALPFQGIPSKSGNSVFIDLNFRPYPKQWTFLMDIKKIAREEVERIIADFTDKHSADVVKENTPGEKQALGDEEIPWKLPTTRKEVSLVDNLPLKVRVFLSNLIYVEKKDLPPAIVKMLRELAAFSNPEFYQAQKMRLPTYDKPRIIDCSEELPCHIGLPRGCLEKMVKVC